MPPVRASAAADATRRIQRTSRVLAAVCLVLIWGLPATVLLYWWLAEPVELARQVNLSADAVMAPLMPWQRALGGMLTLLPVALLVSGLVQARRCFRLFAAGRVFVAESTGYLRRFAGRVAASVAVGMLSSTVLSVVLTVNNPPGMRQLAIGVGSNEVFMLLFAGMVWLMAAVIGQGRSLAEENESFV
ncbi:DUF2975 domain-containing protein [Denitromonas iodatirespirans]|uniref:DUF2975 domain-containing protein n=1 Tax=Denitromonas iodatirespirans TaxID=2795389 RepID=A0A944HDC7_DENI1|nr:DUF2975 domain-containing protein [Denitromonas iodatirespirans]MBT0963592.1 DUF2975 domain-containing protein [Denitromonas iodatirespirans]